MFVFRDFGHHQNKYLEMKYPQASWVMVYLEIDRPLFYLGDPLVNVHIANWNITMLSMGKSTISTVLASIAILILPKGKSH